MRKASAILTLIIALLLLLPTITCADTGTAFDQEVPFGLTKSDNGQHIPVFENATSNNKIDLLSSDLLCSIASETIQGKYYWYQIIYLDDQGEPKTGYVKESNFRQLNLSDYTQLLTDPQTVDLITQYLDLSETSPLFQQVQASTSASTGSKKHQYILNTNTRKFHYPDCKSVKQMKEKNKKSYTGTREEIIAMGYVPCKNCNP